MFDSYPLRFVTVCVPPLALMSGSLRSRHHNALLGAVVTLYPFGSLADARLLRGGLETRAFFITFAMVLRRRAGRKPVTTGLLEIVGDKYAHRCLPP